MSGSTATVPSSGTAGRGILGWGVSVLVLLALQGLIGWTTGQEPWSTPWGITVLGVFVAGWIFAGGLSALRVLLRPGWAPLAVARVVLEEASRRRVALLLVGSLIFAVVGLPFWLAAETRLDYRIQSFLSYTLGLVTLLLSLVTVFLACGAIADEIEDRRIHHAFVKPVRRGSYLLGKFIGLALLNAWILLVSGVAIYSLATLQVETAARSAAAPADPDAPAGAPDPGLDTEGLRRVYEEVLTARRSVDPEPPPGYFEARAREFLAREDRVAELRAQGMDEEAIRRWAWTQASNTWLYLEPGDVRSYRFPGLSSGETPVLRVQPRAWGGARGDLSELRITLGERTETLLLASNEIASIPLESAGSGDELQVSIENVRPAPESRRAPRSLSFDPGQGLKVMHVAGSFGGNLTRALLIVWIKISFLAALGLCASTTLGFPTASLLVLMLALSAATSGYLLETGEDDHHGHSHEHEAAPLLKTARDFGLAIAGVLQLYTQYPTTPSMVEGTLIPWRTVVSCGVWIGLGWSGVLLVLGSLLLRIREVARVQV